MPDEKHKFDETIEQRLSSIVLDNELQTATQNSTVDFEDFEAHIDLFDGERSEREYDWMSNIRLPEFATHILTQSSDDVAQYFKSRDFVEAYVMDKSREAIDASDSASELINTTLNRRDLYYYQKYVRAKLMTYMNRGCWAECWWEQQLSVNQVAEIIETDEYGEEIGEPEVVNDYEIIRDQFNFDIHDPRNVFVVDTKYAYSAQQKESIIIRSETTYEKLLAGQERHGYFNLDLVKELKSPMETETKRGTIDRDGDKTRADNKVDNAIDKFKRFGKFWYLDGKPGIDEEGNPLPKATLEECLITFVKSGSSKILIGFHKQVYEDHYGNSYKPLIRGLEYIHPTSDSGKCDAEFAHDLQIAIDDTFNMNNDRTQLATMPTFKGKRYVMEDTDAVYWEPNHVIDLEDPASDLLEMKIDDNIQGGLAQMGILTDKMRNVTATPTPEIGTVPELSSTTATAVASANQGATQRNNYKSMTFENTFLSELYWMIIQMTWQFAKPETGKKLMGDKVLGFNPEYDYFYRPLSQNIETEYSKGLKTQRWTSILQVVGASQHPDAPKMFNYIIFKIAELMGDEYENFGDIFLNPNKPMQIGAGQQTAQPGGIEAGAASNQNMIPMSQSEVFARQGA